MKDVKENLERVVKYTRDGFNFITLYFAKNGSSKIINEKDLEKITYKGYEDVKNIGNRVESEMMKIKAITKNENDPKLYVSYCLKDTDNYYVIYNESKDNEEKLRAIKSNQDKQEKKELKVKETKKSNIKKFLAVGCGAVVVLGLLCTNIGKDKNNSKPKLISTDTNQFVQFAEEPIFTATEEPKFTATERPTFRPIPESLRVNVPVATPVQTQIPIVVLQPESVPTQRPMVIVQPEIVTNDQEELLAVQKIRAALNEAARIDSQSGTPNNTNSLYSDESIVNSIKLVNNDFSFLSIDDSTRYDKLSQSMNVYKAIQSAYLIYDQDGARISDYIKDPQRRNKIAFVENQAKEFVGNKKGNDGVMPIVQTFDENDSIGDLIISGYINTIRLFSTQPAEKERIQEAVNEIENMNRVFDDCAGKARQR